MPHKPRKLRAACVQMRSGVDPAANLENASAFVRQAAGEGAQFVATPEMTTVLDQNPKRLFSHLKGETDNVELPVFAALAAELGIWLLIGSAAIAVEGGKAANRSFLFAPDGTIAARYDKIHMFDVALPDGETWRESAIYEAGDAAISVETPLAQFGLTICYDLRFAWLYRALAQSGAEVLCAPAAFTRQTGKAHWKTLITARAIENGAFVIAPGQGGRHEDGRETYGGSLIVGPWGEVLAEASDDAPGVILADLDLTAVHKARAAIPNLALEQRRKVINVKV